MKTPNTFVQSLHIIFLLEIISLLGYSIPMLTKTDLNQIRDVVHEEVDVVVDNKLKPVKKDLRYLKKTADLIVKNYDEGDVRDHLGLQSN